MTARPSLARAWALLATALLAPLLIGSPAAAADDPPALASFGISGAADGAPDQRSSLNVTAAPGSVLHDFVAILNQTDAQIDLEVYATDALNTADGAVGLPDRATAPTDAGSWVSLGATSVQVPGQSSAGIGYVVVPVTVSIPADAEPGSHLAGVVASLTSSGTATGGGRTPPSTSSSGSASACTSPSPARSSRA